MMALAIVLLVLGSVGTLTATFLEWRRHEPVYALMMKLFPWAFGVGAVILALSSW